MLDDMDVKDSIFRGVWFSHHLLDLLFGIINIFVI